MHDRLLTFRCVVDPIRRNRALADFSFNLVFTWLELLRDAKEIDDHWLTPGENTHCGNKFVERWN